MLIMSLANMFEIVWNNQNANMQRKCGNCVHSGMDGIAMRNTEYITLVLLNELPETDIVTTDYAS
jgi:hypothetical protein